MNNLHISTYKITILADSHFDMGFTHWHTLWHTHTSLGKHTSCLQLSHMRQTKSCQGQYEVRKWIWVLNSVRVGSKQSMCVQYVYICGCVCLCVCLCVWATVFINHSITPVPQPLTTTCAVQTPGERDQCCCFHSGTKRKQPSMVHETFCTGMIFTFLGSGLSPTARREEEKKKLFGLFAVKHPSVQQKMSSEKAF